MTSKTLIFATAAILLCFTINLASGESVIDVIRRTPELSEFSKVLQEFDPTAIVVMDNKALTVFAPSNSAFDKADSSLKNLKDKFTSYHITFQMAEKSYFPSTVQTFTGGAPLFLTYRYTDDDSSEKVLEYYVNNAKILQEMDFRAKDGSKQILYIIDEVLEPFIPTTGNIPNALQVLTQPSIYGITESLGAFSSRVRQVNQGQEFEKVGNHTFFIPVGSIESENPARLREIDELVIKGHVIPGQVLFTRTMGQKTYQSDSFTPQLKVEISMVNHTSSEIQDGHSMSGNHQGYVVKVKSNTLQSDNRHKKGVVLSKIVKANIPVKNGVVHLIENPLMIIDTNVFTFFKNEEFGRLSKFFELMGFAPDFRYDVQASGDKTVFAPNNEAFERLGADKITSLKANISALTRLLRVHMVQGSVSSDDVRSERITEKMSYDPSMKLYFRVTGDDRNRTLIVQGGGVNAVAVQADIGATDGIIHVIDRVLGMPYLNVYETLKGTETDLNETFQLGRQDQWSDKLNDMGQKFTFFAPSDSAWHELNRELPSAYKQLKMGSFSYHTKKILDRHLVVGKELTKNDLKNTETIRTINSNFRIERGPLPDDLFVAWEGYKARIVRPDVQATNGIIHIIERVMMKNRDLIKNAANYVTSNVALTMFSTALMLIASSKL